MNKVITCASLAALGAVGLQAQYVRMASAAPTGATKPWSVSAKLRGFYDDNYATLPRARSDGGPTARKSFGFQVAPSARLSWVQGATAANLSYEYDMRYYEDRPQDTADHSHQIVAGLNHSFSERYRVEISDNFVIAQEPDLIDPIVKTSFLRTEGNNLRNTAAIDFEAKMTELLTLRPGYSNTIYDYEQKGPGSRSALLDRVEHLARLDLRWAVRERSTLITGYQFGITDQTSKDALAVFPGSPSSDVRDNRSHYGYLGLDQSIRSDLSAQARVGVQYTEYPNALAGMSDSSVGPYADAQINWNYSQYSVARLGVRHARNQTDVAVLTLAGVGNPTADQESTTVYAALTHRLTPKITGNLSASAQTSKFSGGVANRLEENYFSLGADVGYAFNQYLSAEAGYLFDRLDTDLANRGFSRNRVYLGVRATY